MDGINNVVATELIAINYAKRRLGLLSDEWYKLDAEFTEKRQFECLPRQSQINEAVRTLTG
jgi:hypothetical protein